MTQKAGFIRGWEHFLWFMTLNYVLEFNTLPVLVLMVRLSTYTYKNGVFHCIKYVIYVCVCILLQL